MGLLNCACRLRLGDGEEFTKRLPNFYKNSLNKNTNIGFKPPGQIIRTCVWNNALIGRGLHCRLFNRLIDGKERCRWEISVVKVLWFRVPLLCLAMRYSLIFIVPFLYKSSALLKMLFIVLMGRSLFEFTLKIFIRERAPSCNSGCSRNLPSTIRI